MITLHSDIYIYAKSDFNLLYLALQLQLTLKWGWFKNVNADHFTVIRMNPHTTYS